MQRRAAAIGELFADAQQHQETCLPKAWILVQVESVMTSRDGNAALSVEALTVRGSDLKPEVLPRLIGTVFHVTSSGALNGIRASGLISSNQDGSFEFTFPQSRTCYGRQHGYVCLFDLRDVQEDAVNDALMKFYFLKPTAADPVFLFLDQCEYPRLVPWTEAPMGDMVIPYVETWYPGDIPVAALTHALVVTVQDDDMDSAYRGTMCRLRKDVEKLLDSGLVRIEAANLHQLRQRAEEWVAVAREAGLEVDLDWDEGRVKGTADGFAISVHAIHPNFPE